MILRLGLIVFKTLSVVASCILGLIENPAIVKRAQAELDSVIKSGHLPDFDDQDNLPYITALTMEALRWRVITPIAIPRCLQEDDEYKGYRLPKGSIVIPNSWCVAGSNTGLDQLHINFFVGQYFMTRVSTQILSPSGPNDFFPRTVRSTNPSGIPGMHVLGLAAAYAQAVIWHTQLCGLR